MTSPFDFHTHRLDAEDAVISVSPDRFSPESGKWYSVGIHPWDTAQAMGVPDEELLRQCAAHPQVLAIGETGLDSLRGAEMSVQREVFARHLSLAASVGKPVVVHSVRTAQEILAQRRGMRLTAVPLAIHGMRANERVARLLLDAGCYLSYGIRFNPAALLATPLDRLLIETDDAPSTIVEVARLVADTLSLDVDELIGLTNLNARRLLQMP